MTTPRKRTPRKIAAAKAVAHQPLSEDKDTPDENACPSCGVPPFTEHKSNCDVWASVRQEFSTAKAFVTPYYPTVHELWIRVMNQVRSIEKGDYNEDQGFRFRGVDATVEAVGPALRSVGVLVVPHEVRELSAEAYTTKRGTRMVNRTVKVQWRIYGPQGDWLQGESMGEAADAGDKSMSKAQSVAYRVFLLQALNVPTGEPDPDSQAHERATDADMYGGYPQPVRTQTQQSRPAPQQAAGEENQAKASDLADDLAEARKQLWATAQGLGWKWDALAARFRADYGRDTSLSNAATVRQFLDIIVREAEQEEDAKRIVQDQLGGKEIQQDAFPESVPGSESLI